MANVEFVPLSAPSSRDRDDVEDRARDFAEKLRYRRSVRHYGPDPVPKEVIRHALEAAASAPSGANQQPWRFIAISDPSVRKQVREFAEIEDAELYNGIRNPGLLSAIRLLGASPRQPHFEEAPWLIAVFAKDFDEGDERVIKDKHNVYVAESVGIATGMMLTALHMSGLATLVHEPIGEDYLREIAGCGAGDRLAMLVLVGFAADNAQVPRAGMQKKPFHSVASFLGENSAE